jgi:hypothetical protein
VDLRVARRMRCDHSPARRLRLKCRVYSVTLFSSSGYFFGRAMRSQEPLLQDTILEDEVSVKPSLPHWQQCLRIAAPARTHAEPSRTRVHDAKGLAAGCRRPHVASVPASPAYGVPCHIECIWRKPGWFGVTMRFRHPGARRSRRVTPQTSTPRPRHSATTSVPRSCQPSPVMAWSTSACPRSSSRTGSARTSRAGLALTAGLATPHARTENHPPVNQVPPAVDTWWYLSSLPFQRFAGPRRRRCRSAGQREIVLLRL